ncbi:MAG: PAS domain S-box protein [Bacteroidetes bacterium]|nr:PAS domain S-box protein [Bacteroidota bacterium]
MKIKHRHSFFLLLLIAVFVQSGLFAQNGDNADERDNDIRSIDKMITVLKQDTLTPEEKFTIAYNTLKQSIEHSYIRGKAESYLQIGRYFVYKRKHTPAIHFLLSASQLFKLLKDTSGLMSVDHSIFSVEIYLKDYSNALSTCRHGLELARQKKDLVLTGFFLEKMADVFHEQQDTSKSLDYYMESLKYYSESNDRRSILGVYMSIGGIYLDQRRYADVIKMYDTLSVFADSVDPATAGTMYTRMAHVFDQQQNYSKALYYNKKALEVRRRARFSDAENSSTINVAGNFFKMNRPDSGWHYMDIGLAEAKLNNRVYYMRNGYTVLYNYYLKTGDMEKALENFKLMVAMNDSILKERLNTDINVIRTGQNILILKEGIKLLESQNVLQKLLIRNQKIFKFLLFAIVLAVMIAVGIIVRINIRHRKSKRDIENLNIKLQHEAAERKLIQKKTVEKEDQYRFIAEHSLDLIARIDKNYNFTYASPAVADIFGYSTQELLSINLLDLLVTGYTDFLKEQLKQVVATRRPHSIAFLARKKGNEPIWVESTFNPVFNPKTGDFREFVSVTRNIQELKKREMGIVEGTKQKENLLREIHHRVKNNFAILVSLISMQKAQSQNEDVKQSLTNLQLRIRTMALVHEMLYRSEDFEKISFPDYVRSVASVISATYGRMNVHLDFEMEPVIINIETAIPLGLMLNEILSNAYRHAFDGNSEGTITVSFKKHKAPNFYALTVSDSGIGLPEGFSMEGSKTMGLQIVDILVKQIEAQLEIGQVNGTSFTIIFPIEA